MSGVIVDTCIWSLALRGKEPRSIAVAERLSSLIADGRAKIIGLIRQELLSGYSNFQQYKKLQEKMVWFPSQEILDEDYEIAAKFSNTCRQKGVQGSHIDFLIVAVSVRLNMPIYTEDKDFEHYQKHIAFELYQ